MKLLRSVQICPHANVEKAHQHGLKIIVWTINRKEEAKDEQKGFDSIATDKPDSLSVFKS